MSHTLTYHRIQNVQLRHCHVGRGIGPYTRVPAWAHAHAYAPSLAHAHSHTPAPVHAHATATAPHPRYCVAGSTSVIHKMTIPWRRSPHG
ncbi:hypothetical protein O181_075106 [Austropuccinia psidii MF-1]|uniref:Uncharacterized protein n=1 Tax=Austropuccinia psidii MF-1 TaxID=1389203 RepID=A0A9Q3I9V6_9BASI|nr:hypothetical protein [Austropuccinia psidii MF-1]